MNRIADKLSRFGPSTPRHALNLCLFFGIAILLGGCASLNQAADWTGRQASSGWKEVISVLRPAPKANPILANFDPGDAALNTARLEARVENAKIVRVAVNETIDNGVQIFRPGQRSPSGPRIINTPRSQPQAAPMQPAPTSADPYAYVRPNGTTDMADWQACEIQTGGAFIVTRGGVEIAPDFDRCLRAKGYLSETDYLRDQLVGGLRR
jgi:hypothetical protein